MVSENFLPKLLAAWCLVIVCAGCSAETTPKTLTLATFNMEWLGDNTPDDRKIRTEADMKLLAEVLRDTEADICAVQEVENDAAMKRLLAYLPEYRFVLGATGGKQHVGFLYKAAALDVKTLGEVASIAVEPERTRAGYLLQIQQGKAKWLFLAVHLKSTSRADSTRELEARSRELRRLQAAQLRVWSDSVLQADSLVRLVMVGDFNDSPKRKNTSLDTLKNAPHLVFLTRDNTSCTYEGLPAIDHIVCSTQAVKRVRQGSLYTLNLHAMLKEQEVKRVSDHCPVICRFDVSEE